MRHGRKSPCGNEVSAGIRLETVHRGPAASPIRTFWEGKPEAEMTGGTAQSVLNRHAEQTGLLVASAVAPQTFVRSLGPRSWADQAVVTGVVTALSYAATVATQDALTSVVSAWSSRTGGTDVRTALLVVNGAAVPVGLGLARALPV